MDRLRFFYRRALQDSDGTAAIDYALLLALVVGFVVLGAELFGAGVSQATAGLTAGMEGEHPRRSPPVVPVRHETVQVACHHHHHDEHDDCDDCRAEQPRWHLPLLTLSLVSGCPLWYALRKSRTTPKTTEPEEILPASPEAATPKILAKRQECLRILSGEPELLLEGRIQVAHLMTSPAETIGPDDSAESAAARMNAENLSQMVVVDAERRVLGLLARSDLAGRGPATVRGRMSATTSVAPDTALGTAATLLLARHAACLPVVKHDRCVGVITLSDLAIALQCLLQVVQKLSFEAE